MSKRKFLLALLLLISSVGFAAAQSNPVDPAAALERGNESFAKADYEAAIREYGSVPASAGETYAQALYNIGVSYYELWLTADAIAFYQRAIVARNGQYPRASYALGIAFEDQGKLVEAQEAYGQSIAGSHGEFAAAHYRLGLLMAGRGDYERAAASFRKALNHPGLHVAASHNNLGVMLVRLGRLKEALREFEFALRQSGGTFADASNNLKRCRSLLTAPSANKVAVFRVSTLSDGSNK
ncbi:MAG: tetratricopeptide repeat protein [Acidobacteriota bacterium]